MSFLFLSDQLSIKSLTQKITEKITVDEPKSGNTSEQLDNLDTFTMQNVGETLVSIILMI